MQSISNMTFWSMAKECNKISLFTPISVSIASQESYGFKTSTQKERFHLTQRINDWSSSMADAKTFLQTDWWFKDCYLMNSKPTFVFNLWFNLFVLLFLVTQCLIVAIHPCMESIPIFLKMAQFNRFLGCKPGEKSYPELPEPIEHWQKNLHLQGNQETTMHQHHICTMQDKALKTRLYVDCWDSSNTRRPSIWYWWRTLVAS